MKELTVAVSDYKLITKAKYLTMTQFWACRMKPYQSTDIFKWSSHIILHEMYVSNIYN
jgi:hypothetical protein